MVNPLVKRYLCISEEETKLRDLFGKSGMPIDYLIIAGKETSTNLLHTEHEHYNFRRFPESIERIRGDSRSTKVGFPSIVERVGGIVQQSYQFNADVSGALTTYERIAEGLKVGVGIEILGLNANFITPILRAYRLPFPANIRDIRS